MVVVVWVLDAAVVVVFGPVAAGFVAVFGCDVAVVTGGSGCERRSWRVCGGAVDRAGSECRLSRGAGGWFEAGGGVIVVAVKDVDSADGGCADVVSGDVADSDGDGGLGAVSSRGIVCVRASTEAVEVVWVLESVVSRIAGSVCTSWSIPTSCSCVRGSMQLPVP
jgi:hypothetical protein